MIPQHKIQDIRDRAADDIVDIVGSYIKLKRSGSSYKAKCPFHDENTASFSISPERGIYKCFGCGEGGDTIDFLMNYESMAFMEVIKQLARRYMIDISDGSSSKPRKRGKSRKEIYEAILPGIGKMKNRIRKQHKVYLVFDSECQKDMAKSAAWLPVELPVTRGQYKILGQYADELILLGKFYDKKNLFLSVLHGIKSGIDSIYIWTENGYKQHWLGYLLASHPNQKDQIKNIIAQIPDQFTYKIYQQEFIKQLNKTSKK